MGTIRLGLRAFLSLLWIFCIFFPLALTTLLRLPGLNSRVMQLSFYVGCLLWGLRVRTQGTLATVRPLLVVSNHFSYLDVFALGAVMPARFTPKSEIASWPGIGFMCRITGCLFIERKASKTLKNKKILEKARAQKAIISLFPEGTTNEGGVLLPFKTSFFSLAEAGALTVQPVTVRYTAVDGHPLTWENRDVVGWYGDAYFFPHVARFLRQKKTEVTLIFHPPLLMAETATRKALAIQTAEIIQASLPAFPGSPQKKTPSEDSEGAKPNNGG